MGEARERIGGGGRDGDTLVDLDGISRLGPESGAFKRSQAHDDNASSTETGREKSRDVGLFCTTIPSSHREWKGGRFTQSQSHRHEARPCTHQGVICYAK